MDKKVKVVFLDRDGVINEFPGYTLYVTKWEEFRFIPGSIEAIRLLKEHDFKLFVVSNQAGVAKGLYTQQDLDYMTENMIKEIRHQGGDLDGIYYCLHRNEDNCNCRKPKTGLLQQALKDLNKKPHLCFFIGDSFRDMKTAAAAGCQSALVLSGQEILDNKDSWEFHPDFIFKNLLEAARHLCTHYEE